MTDSARARHRRSLRLQGYDYAQAGAYFVTICTQDRACLFGEVVDGKMLLNDAGQATEQCWRAIPDHFPHVVLDAFVVMPNHVYGILFIDGSVGANNHSPLHLPVPQHLPCGTAKTLGSIVRGFKIGVTQWFRGHAWPHAIWQRNYYEHIIRSEATLRAIREYIANNPLQWALDRENPANFRYGEP